MSFTEEQRQKITKHSEIRGDPKTPKTFFDLIQKVGHSGSYQFRLMIIFSIVNFVTGIVLISTAFFYRKRAFECKAHGLLVSEANCLDYVCDLPKDQWKNYFALDDNSFDSLASGEEFYCDNHALVDMLSSFTYFGAFLGYLVISFFADNWGRRTSLLLGWGIETLGAVVVASSVNIYMASVGLFMCGFGADVCINIAFFFFGEVVGDQKRQKYSVFVQIWFPVGAMIITGFFYFMNNWRVIWLILIMGPSALGLALMYFSCFETPQFLVKKGPEHTVKIMNKIGKINLGIDNVLTRLDVEQVMAEQMTQNFQGKLFTPIDLCRFPSLRIITICSSIISFMVYAMYYGPALIIDSIGFNIYVSNIVVNLSELVTFIPSYFLIESIQRRKWGLILMSSCAFCSLLLNFIQKPEQSDMSIEAILEIIIVFIFRASVAFYFCFFQIYFCELYPSRARGMGSGVVSAIGTLASTSSPIYLGYLQRSGINPMTVFVLFGIIGLSNVMLLSETKGVPLKQQIDEIEMIKENKRTQISQRQSKIASIKERNDRSEKSQRSKKSLLTDQKVNQSSGYSRK